MTSYRYTGNLKAGLFGLGIAIAAALLWYSQGLVKELQASERRLLDIYAHLIGRVASESGNENINFLFDEVIRQIQFPIVVTDPDGQAVSWRNIAVDTTLDEQQTAAILNRLVARMDKEHQPVLVTFEGIEISRIHYGTSSVVTRLRWLPYLEILVAGLFILVGFAGFTLIRNSEKRSIWTGMARETAHQLGTPISSLMGWVEHLRSRQPGSSDILDELEADVRRLEQIADRFHKVGTVPRFDNLDLIRLAESSMAYFRQRLGERSDVLLSVDGEPVTVAGAETLLQWALENLIKNALDACRGREGRIGITIGATAEGGFMEVRDNGAGIPAKDHRNIFRPGYSTKSGGWGLGLSLTQRIVEEIHRGKLRLVASRPGETIIRITLPAGRPSPTSS